MLEHSSPAMLSVYLECLDWSSLSLSTSAGTYDAPLVRTRATQLLTAVTSPNTVTDLSQWRAYYAQSHCITEPTEIVLV